MTSTSFPPFLFIIIIFFCLSTFSLAAANREAPASLGNIGKYTTAVSVGTPASQFQAMVDVTEDFIWVQCDTNHRQSFDSSKYSTYQHIPCNETACQNLENQTCFSGNSCGYIIGMPDGMPYAMHGKLLHRCPHQPDDVQWRCHRPQHQNRVWFSRRQLHGKEDGETGC